jgi:hypothetical protein
MTIRGCAIAFSKLATYEDVARAHLVVPHESTIRATTSLLATSSRTTAERFA